MISKKWKMCHIFLIIVFIVGILFFSPSNPNSSKSQNRTDFDTNISNFQSDFTPQAGFLDPRTLNQIDPEIIANESQLMALATSGDGLSWETAYIIEKIKIEQNFTTYGLVITNISRYVI